MKGLKVVSVIFTILLTGALALLVIAGIPVIFLCWATSPHDDPGAPYTVNHTSANLTFISLDISTSGDNVVHLEESPSSNLTIDAYRTYPTITYEGNDSVLYVNIRALRPEEMRGQGTIVYLHLPCNATYDIEYDMKGHKDWSTHAVETGEFDGNITIILNGETIFDQ